MQAPVPKDQFGQWWGAACAVPGVKADLAGASRGGGAGGTARRGRGVHGCSQRCRKHPDPPLLHPPLAPVAVNLTAAEKAQGAPVLPAASPAPGASPSPSPSTASPSPSSPAASAPAPSAASPTTSAPAPAASNGGSPASPSGSAPAPAPSAALQLDGTSSGVQRRAAAAAAVAGALALLLAL